MKNQSFLRKLGDFAMGKGFYIVLFLCVATIGISGYYLLRSMVNDVGQPAQPAGAGASVSVPDRSSAAPTPPVTPITPPAAVTPQPAAQPDATAQPDDPEPVKTAEPEPEDQGTVSKVFTWPVNGAVLRDYSVEVLSLDPTLGDWRTHGGLDLAAAEGVQVLAISAGTVSQVYQDGLMGTTVVVDHGGGLSSWYCNLAQDPAVAVGDTVSIGQVLGEVGRTAIAEVGVDSHLHLETTLDGQMVDPRAYLPE